MSHWNLGFLRAIPLSLWFGVTLGIQHRARDESYWWEINMDAG